jgi:hypothetical protein
MALLIMANLGYCRLIILHPFKMEMKRLVPRAKVSIPKKLANFCGQIEFWAFWRLLKYPISNLERLTIIGRLVLGLPTMYPMLVELDYYCTESY